MINQVHNNYPAIAKTNRFDQYQEGNLHHFKDKRKTLESRLLFTPNDSALMVYLESMGKQKRKTR